MGGVQPNVIIKYESVREGAVHFFRIYCANLFKFCCRIAPVLV